MYSRFKPYTLVAVSGGENRTKSNRGNGFLGNGFLNNSFRFVSTRSEDPPVEMPDDVQVSATAARNELV
jgi:hypothetical protein